MDENGKAENSKVIGERMKRWRDEEDMNGRMGR